MDTVVTFEQPECTDLAVAGGKGANLGKLSAAGFPVPTGFVVTTAAYVEFLGGTGLGRQIDALLDGLPTDPVALEDAAARIRGLVGAATLPPELATRIEDAYRTLGADALVAVRSSGTAEDLAGASFAGLHDTFLDVRGAPEVVAAVQACWASLWTARAISYRTSRDFDHRDVRMAVVVQVMVDAEVSGVMFTGNPLTAATDEYLVNATWGLGEALVQGIVTPDQYVVKATTLRVVERTIGEKSVEIVRDPAGAGTVERSVSDERRTAASCDDALLRELGELGRRVTTCYGGFPQDIEWAWRDGTCHLLQSRPVTGVEFAWDAELDNWQPEEEIDDTIWNRALADELWNGAVTPLMYSWRGVSFSVDYRAEAMPMFGRPDLGKLRMLKYHKGEIYFNADADRIFAECAPPPSRLAVIEKQPPARREEVLDTPFSTLGYLKLLLRDALRPRWPGPSGWMNCLEDYFENRVPEAVGLPDDELRYLSDTELRRYAIRQANFEHQYNVDIGWPGLMLYVRDLMVALHVMITKWYDGTNPNAYTDIITGSRSITATVAENIELYDLATEIKNSPRLRSLFDSHTDGAFFDALEATPEGRAFKERTDAFVARCAHRGHSDRDIYFPRYGDDPAVLYRSLHVHMKSDVDPREREEETNRRRTAAIEDVMANLERQPLGFAKVRAVRWVLDYVLRFIEFRDNERFFIDRNTYSIKKAYVEANRRLVERGLVESERDFYFLSEQELFELLDGRANMPLTRAKIEARMRNFDRMDRKEFSPPKFLQRNRPLTAEADAVSVGPDGETILRGMPTSSGSITATARVIKELSKIGDVNPGEILIANSTDPGWTPVFAVISGVIVETGGVLSHSSCLAREYGFPAAQVDNALHLIPDGATITLNGDTGEVLIDARELVAVGGS